MREQDPRGTSVGQIEKRRERMADGRRYMVYFTFEPLLDESSADEPGTNVTDATRSEEQPNV